MVPGNLLALVVEDDPSIRNMLCLWLLNMGIGVMQAQSGRVAIETLNQRAPDIICLDLTLPEISGFDVCEHVRRTPRLAHIPVIVISARGQLLDRATAEEAGATAFLAKPVSMEVFSACVKDIVSRLGAPA